MVDFFSKTNIGFCERTIYLWLREVSRSNLKGLTGDGVSLTFLAADIRVDIDVIVDGFEAERQTNSFDYLREPVEDVMILENLQTNMTDFRVRAGYCCCMQTITCV